jgi:hypothetical protein
MIRTRTVFISLFFFIASVLTGQSLTGLTGMLNAPTADMLKDGTFYTGVNYLDRNYISDYSRGKYNCLIYYFDLTFLPFLEVNFRNTRQLDNPDHHHTVDRMFSGKLRVLKERKIWPSIAIGANDVLTTSDIGNQYFGALYLVVTKNIEVKKNLFGGTIGYAFPVFRNNQFSGIFGGISFSPFFLRQFTLMAEYDSKYFNIGGSFLFFKHLYIFGLLQGMERFSGGIAYRISAFAGFKKKNSQQGLP